MKPSVAVVGVGLYIAAILWEVVLLPDVIRLPAAVGIGVRIFLIFVGAALFVMAFEGEEFRVWGFFFGSPLFSTMMLTVVGILVAATIGGLSLASLPDDRARIPVRNVAASSFRPSYTTASTGETRSYYATNVIDEDLGTAWIPQWSFGPQGETSCEEMDDGNIVAVLHDDVDGSINNTPELEWISIELAEPTVVEKIAIVGGYAQSQSHFTGHNRLRDVLIEFDDARVHVQLPNVTYESPAIELTVKGDYTEPTSTVTVGILSVYCGTGNWDQGPIEGGASIAISELSAYAGRVR